MLGKIVHRVLRREEKARYQAFYESTVIRLKKLFGYSEAEARMHAHAICSIFKRTIREKNLIAS